MKFLIDNALSPQIAIGLVEAGYDAVHVRNVKMGTSPDIDIFDLAIAEQRVIISADTDFGTLLSLRSEKFPSVILFRRGISHIPQTQLSILLLNLPTITDLLEQGSIIIFDKIEFVPEGYQLTIEKITDIKLSSTPYPLKIMSKNTLFDKVWESHTVATLPSGQTQLFIGLHLIHEVTSPQAFAMMRDRGLKVPYPERTVATVDHIVPTEDQSRPLADSLAEEMMQHLENNTKEHGIRFYNVGSGSQGIVHVIAPEQGLTQPGMTIACGDSHTSTHGAFGAIAFGIGTSQVRDVLASQTLALGKLKVRKIEVNGTLQPGVYAKDVILHIIRKLGVKGGVGYAYEFAGTTFENMDMEARMTVCNMAIEGGARCGYINPDRVTYDYLKGLDFAPKAQDWDKAVAWWESLRSDKDAQYDDVVIFDAAEIAPTITWGITPAQGIGVDEPIPTLAQMPADEQAIAEEAYQYMDLAPGTPIIGTKVDVCFVGSCTNGRITDLREAAKLAAGKQVATGVKAFIVPGSERVKKQAEAEGLDVVFKNAGFEWREAGCSMCLAMNPDKLVGRQISASSSNRNFKGRQGSSSGRTLLMSPVMVIAAAVTGKVTDVRELMN